MARNHAGWNLSFQGTRTEVYLIQVVAGARFVARFKYAKPRASARHFAAFLQRHFTPAEYFALLDEGQGGLAPLAVLRTKGYLSLNQLAAQRQFDPTEQQFS